MIRGTVKFFHPKKAWGAISSPELPDGADAWVHFSVIEMDGYRPQRDRNRCYTSMCEPMTTVRSRGRPKCSPASAAM
jgi:cold shock CspA family protein